MSNSLAMLTDRAFAEALADNVMYPDPLEQAAFRSPVLADRSLAACRFLIAEVNSTIRQREGETRGAWLRRAEHFRHRVGMERRLLEAITAGLRAQRGVLPASPNPRARAMRRLATLHPERFLELVREEQAVDRERAAAQKRERKAARRRECGRP